jgi:Fur family transcriptional regulator, ferric uptake regulator
MTASRPATPAPRLRSTRQRTAVARMLEDTGDFRSAQEIHEKLRLRGEGIGLTTVYRTLQTLAEAGEIDMLRTASGEAIYRRCSAHHHHHLVCRHCGHTVEVEGPTVELWAAKVADDHGFTDIDHTVEISGRCPTCATP